MRYRKRCCTQINREVQEKRSSKTDHSVEDTVNVGTTRKDWSHKQQLGLEKTPHVTDRMQRRQRYEYGSHNRCKGTSYENEEYSRRNKY